MVNLAVFYCKELQNMNLLNYTTKKQSVIKISINRSFMDKSVRRLLLLEAWGQFEFYFSKKVPGSGNMLTKVMVKNYYQNQNKSVPNAITFFRETRNCLHGNGVYNINKQSLHCSIKKQQYSLVPGQEIKFADYQFLLDIIDTASRLL